MIPQWVRERDWALLGLLFCLNVGSAYTTILGARQIMPTQEMADVLGFTIQITLFLMLSGFAVTGAPIRKWIVVTIFAGMSIYTSFFTYYEQLAKDADNRAQLDTALQAHSGFVSSTGYQSARSQADALMKEAEALFDLAEQEKRRGSSSGVSGYGPIAKKYAREGSEKKIEAERLAADVERFAPHFEFEIAELTPEEVYRKDLEAWQLIPADWKVGVPQPERERYVDMKAEVRLLTPYQRIRDGEMPAMTALAMATLVDGIAIFLGTAIRARQRPVVEAWSQGLAGVIGQVKNSAAVVRAAVDQPGLAAPNADDLLDDSIQVVDLRIVGRGSDFLTTFYQAIHPETGVLDFSGLQRHPNGTYRIASRMLVDQLRNPQLGWIVVDEGWWSVPEEAYPAVTAWLGEHIRRECEQEARAVADTEEVTEPERTLRLLIPAS